MSKRRSTYQAPRPRHEILVAVAVAALIVVLTASLIWITRPNRDSGSSSDDPVLTVPSTTTEATVPAPTDTTAPAETTTTVAP